MLFLLSPAKKLDYDSALPALPHTQPRFVPQSAELIQVLRQLSTDDIAALMSLSPALAQLNHDRYAQWEPSFTDADSRQAILAFNGDVYEGLDARTLAPKDLEWAQQHLAILSGLYGVLRPLDLMRPYRLEMGTRLETAQGKTLYAYWGTQIAHALREQLAESKGPVINLASEEYFKAVDQKALSAEIVQCVFQDWKNGAWKIISFHAKRARGLMARHAIEQRARTLDDLRSFDSEGYRYDAAASSTTKLVFRRRLED
ncbi:peroxide stress protein YaaA [Kerstersia similis]|uniref:peroxide stress protein YaaA n=1 Tax=Kerstersia similis TaxID=206505 RepID=UPI0039F0D63D